MVRGGQYGKHGFRYSPQGAQLAASEPQPPADVPDRGFGYSGTVGARYGTRRWGGAYGFGKSSIDDLLARTDGWGIVIEREDGERYVASAAESPRRDIIALSLTFETNNMSDWRVTVPPDPILYEYHFSDVVIGYNGERLFHGQLLPTSGDSGGAIEIGGFGPLWWATHGHIDVTYPGGMAWWEAINDCWQRIADITDGKVRGYALRPKPEYGLYIPDDGDDGGQSFEGTPLGVLKELHGHANMVFSLDHSDPAAVGVSFVPGTERRVAEWRAEDYSVDLDPKGYYNRVLVKGGQATDAYPYDRWRGTATVSDEELREVTNGQILEYYMDASELGSPGACEQRARQKLEDLRANYTITGDLSITPARAQPGFIYRVEEFEQAAPDAFYPVELPLQSVEHSFAVGEASTTLNFEEVSGVVGAIRERIQPDSLGEGVPVPTDQFAGPDRPIDNWGEAVWGAGVWGGKERNR